MAHGKGFYENLDASSFLERFFLDSRLPAAQTTQRFRRKTRRYCSCEKSDGGSDQVSCLRKSWLYNCLHLVPALLRSNSALFIEGWKYLRTRFRHRPQSRIDFCNPFPQEEDSMSKLTALLFTLLFAASAASGQTGTS